MRKTVTRIVAGALSAALVLTGVNMPEKSASAAAAKLNKSNVVLYVGGNATAKVKAKNVNKVTYKSKDTSVAKVNKTTGKITAKGAGSTKIVAKTDAGKLKCKVRVYKAIKTLATDTKEVTLAPGETKTVGVTVKPAKANETMWKVATSNKAVAKKTKANGSKGTFDINAVAEGTATITVRSTDGGSAPDATVKVNVVAPGSADTAADTDADAPVYTDEDIPEDIASVPTQWGIEILSNPALLNETQDELYVYYAAYDEEGNVVENPAVGWRVTSLDTGTEDTAVRFETENVRECGCLVVKAPGGSQFAKNDIVAVTGESMNSDVTVTANIVVGDVREVADVEFAGILETVTDAQGNTVTTNIGENLPLGFETSQNTYRLAFNGIDQMGNIIVNGTEGYWDLDNSCSGGTYMIGDAVLTENDEIDLNGETPARISPIYDDNFTEIEPAHCYENGIVNGTYYDMFLINGTDVSEKGGGGVFIIVPSTLDSYFCFEYYVCEVYDIATLELVAPEGIIRDGDSNVTVTIRGVYRNGTVVEKMTYSDLASVFGEEIARGITATCADDGNPMRGTATYSAANASVTWTDYYTRDAAYNSAQALYRETCFDGLDREITIDLKGVPRGVDVVTTDLIVKDPSRPTDVVLMSESANASGYSLDTWGHEGKYLGFKDQYGEYMTAKDVEYFYKRAVTDGYEVTDGTGNENGKTYYALGYVVYGSNSVMGQTAAWWDETVTAGWVYEENGLWTPDGSIFSGYTSVVIGMYQFNAAINLSCEGMWASESGGTASYTNGGGLSAPIVPLLTSASSCGAAVTLNASDSDKE